MLSDNERGGKHFWNQCLLSLSRSVMSLETGHEQNPTRTLNSLHWGRWLWLPRMGEKDKERIISLTLRRKWASKAFKLNKKKEQNDALFLTYSGLIFLLYAPSSCTFILLLPFLCFSHTGSNAFVFITVTKTKSSRAIVPWFFQCRWSVFFLLCSATVQMVFFKPHIFC